MRSCSPWLQYVLLKLDLMQQVCKDAAQHTELVKQLRQAKSLKEERAIMKQMEALEVDDKYLAFADKDLELQQDWGYCFAQPPCWTVQNFKAKNEPTKSRTIQSANFSAT